MAREPDGEKLFELEAVPVVPKTVTPAGPTKRFRAYNQSQSFLLPPSLDDWLPEDHEARFISAVVDNLLDLSVIYDSYLKADGYPPYDPSMMLNLLLFAYSTGVTSSREMERCCHVNVAFRWLAANAAPDYRSISRFRRRHLVAIDSLFVQVLALCAQAGLVKLGRVALDGTKLRASASRHKAMSHDRMGPRIEALEEEVRAILAEAEAADAAEDAEFGDITLEGFDIKEPVVITTIAPDPAKANKDISVPELSPLLTRKKTLAEEIAALDIAAMECPIFPKKENDAAAQQFHYEGVDIISLQRLIERDYQIPQPQTAEEVISYYAKRIAQDVKLPSQFRCAGSEGPGVPRDQGLRRARRPS
jgi:transposase